MFRAVFVVILSAGVVHGFSTTEVTSLQIDAGGLGGNFEPSPLAGYGGEPLFRGALGDIEPVDYLGLPGETISFTRLSATPQFGVRPDYVPFAGFPPIAIDSEYESSIEAFVSVTLPTFDDLASIPFRDSFFLPTEYRIPASGTLSGTQVGYDWIDDEWELTELKETSVPLVANGFVRAIIENEQYRVVGFKLDSDDSGPTPNPDPTIPTPPTLNPNPTTPNPTPPSPAGAVPEPESMATWMVLLVLGVSYMRRNGTRNM